MEAINGRDYVCGVRPEHVSVARELDLDNSFHATLKTLTFQGMHYWAEVMLSSGQTVLAIVPQGTKLREGEEVQVGWNLEEAKVFAHQDRGDESSKLQEG